jgi:hypothetical protein
LENLPASCRDERNGSSDWRLYGFEVKTAWDSCSGPNGGRGGNYYLSQGVIIDLGWFPLRAEVGKDGAGGWREGVNRASNDNLKGGRTQRAGGRCTRAGESRCW